MTKIFLLIVTVSLGTVLYASDTIIITAGSKDNIGIKVATAVVLEAYKRINLEAVVENYSLLKSLSMSSNGKSDAELFRARIISEKYPTLYIVDEPLLTINNVCFSIKDNLNIKNWNSLKPYKIAFVRGIKFIENKTMGFDVIAVDNLDVAFNLLKYKRVDVVIADDLNGLYQLKKHLLKDQIFISEPLSTDKLYHYVNIKHKALVPKLEQALKEFDHNVFIEKVLGK